MARPHAAGAAGPQHLALYHCRRTVTRRGHLGRGGATATTDDVVMVEMLRQTAGRRSRVSRAACALTLLLWAGPAQAHDFWIEPSTFHPAPGQTVAIGLRLGQDFIGDAVPRFSNGIVSFFIREAGREEAISGADGIDRPASCALALLPPPSSVMRALEPASSCRQINSTITCGFMVSRISSRAEPAAANRQSLDASAFSAMPRRCSPDKSLPRRSAGRSGCVTRSSRMSIRHGTANRSLAH